jgi:hypothetical protein
MLSLDTREVEDLPDEAEVAIEGRVGKEWRVLTVVPMLKVRRGPINLKTTGVVELRAVRANRPSKR